MGKTIIALFALAAGLAGLCAPDEAATLRVPSQYQTIQAAVDAATLGDVILVAPGAYTSPTPVLIYLKKNIRLAGESGRAATILNGSIEINMSGNITLAGLTINGQVKITCSAEDVVSSCIVQHSAASGVVVSGCPSGAYSNVEISGNVIRDNAGNGVEAELSGGQATFSANDISGNSLSGLYILHSYCAISGNVIHDNRTYGISIDQATASILANTIARNAGFGILIATAGSSRTQTIEHNIVAANKSGGVYGDVVAAHVISCNDVWGNSAAPGGNYSGHVGDQTGVAGNISENPLFCAAAAGDFSLGASSPALSQACGAMGALEEPGCASPVSVRSATWGRIKTLYR